ncbi:TRAFAC clade GTPase domain-containing protein [Kitasatospora griseola]
MAELVGVVLAFLAYLAALTLFVVFVAPIVAAAQALHLVALLLLGHARLLDAVLRRHEPEFQTRPLPRPDDEPQPAHRSYWFGPAQRDLLLIGTHGHRRVRRTAATAFRTVTDRIEQSSADLRPVTVPFGLALYAGLAVGLGLAAGLLGVLMVLHWLVVLLLQGGVRLAAVLLAGVDLALLRIRNLHEGVLCPHCFDRVRRPVHECSDEDCRRRHTELRPGRYGLLHRRCACGRRLPTTLLGGRYRLPGYCTHATCGRQLSTETGRLAEFALPLIGGRAAGKTQLMAAILTLLQRPDPDGRAHGRLADRETEERYQLLREVLEISGHPRATPPELRRGYSVLLDRGRPPRLLHLFDTAGERFVRREETDALRYARAARTFLFVLDPLAVPDFWNQLGPAQADRLDRTLASDMRPGDVFAAAVNAIGAMGVPLKRCRLAVAISKADLLEQALDGSAGLPRQDDSDAARRWLTEHLGLGGLLENMSLEFREVRFFFTASVLSDAQEDGAEPELHESVAPLLRWCLAGSRRPRVRPRPRGAVPAQRTAPARARVLR